MDANEYAKKVAEAIKKGLEVAEETPDGGTCNFDSVYLPIGKEELIKRKNEKVEAALTAAGVGFYHTKGDRSGSRYMLRIPSGGQGARRTAAAERVCNELKELGACMWYQMD